MLQTQSSVGLLQKRCSLSCNFIEKETPTQVFSCEFSETFKNTFFYRTPLLAASDASFLEDFAYVLNGFCVCTK